MFVAVASVSRYIYIQLTSRAGILIPSRGFPFSLVRNSLSALGQGSKVLIPYQSMHRRREHRRSHTIAATVRWRADYGKNETDVGTFIVIDGERPSEGNENVSVEFFLSAHDDSWR